MVTADDVQQARAAILSLADLTPSAERADEALSVPLEWFRWLEGGLWELIGFGGHPDPLDLGVQAGNDPMVGRKLDSQYADRLLALQHLREGSRPLRVGWLFVAGTTDLVSASGTRTRRRVFHPLITRPVRVTRNTLVAFGDAEVSPLVSDTGSSRAFEDRIETGGGAISDPCTTSPLLLQRLPKLLEYARGLARAAGFQATDVVPSNESPEQFMRHRGLRIVAGLGVYCVDQVSQISRASTLRSWAQTSLDQQTAFHSIYVGSPDVSARDEHAPVEVVVPLTDLQRDAVRASRAQPITVISGGPGTGKSHTISAIVSDALARGQSVLVSAKTDAAVDALIALMERQPVTAPVVFGSSERRDVLARRLAAGQLKPADHRDIEVAKGALDAAIRSRNIVHDQLERLLVPELSRSPAGHAELERLRTETPGLFVSAADLADAELLVAQLALPPAGWFARRRRRRRERQLRTVARADPALDLDSIVTAVSMARGLTDATSRDASDDTLEPGTLAGRLDEAERLVQTSLAKWLALETRSSRRLDRAGLAAIGALATALRSGRGARRSQLVRLDDDQLTKALPLWVGTLGDIDDLLPPVAAAFDLVLIDEASGIDQSLAAPALLRASRAVIVGDPFQLRHVSFIADATVQSVLESHRVMDASSRARLDVRRNSLFDAAASSAPVVVLDEHFRSDPHLLDVVGRRIYGNSLMIATRSPVNESTDCIHVERVHGKRNADHVVLGEIHAIVNELRRLLSYGSRSVGVITPFRAQADALESAILHAFSGRELESLNLRVGTVHGFQGNERDVMLCSLGVGPDDGNAMPFIEDPHLLAVLLTRARRQAIMYVSTDLAGDSILSEYIAQSNRPPGTPPPVAPLSRWATQVIDDLRLAGLKLAVSYPVGRHVVDAVTVARGRPIAIVCGLHPGGIEAHIGRHLDLHRLGWTIIDALESRWADRLPELTLGIVGRCRPADPRRAEGTLPS